jgi:hypothetical protein
MYISEAKNNAPCYDIKVWVQFFKCFSFLVAFAWCCAQCLWLLEISLVYISVCMWDISILSQASDLLLHLYFCCHYLLGTKLWYHKL